jgi:membrane protein
MQTIKRNRIFRHLRFFLRRLFDEELTYYAASLSFYTISTVIPIMVIIFSVLPKLSSFSSYYDNVKEFMIEHLLPVQTEIITEYIDLFVMNSTNLGIISLSATLFISMLFFINFAYVANTIFKVKHSSYTHTIVRYFILIIILPSGMALSFYLTSSINTYINTVLFHRDIMTTNLVAFALEWFIFFIFYKFAPNTFVYYKAALISALIATTIWTSTKLIFIEYVFFSKATSTIYGPFAVYIFFLMWMYLSWIIFIYGLRLCYLINRSYRYTKRNRDKYTK